MILCSRRVFLNVVTQLYDLDTLINANYFLVDQIKPTGMASFLDEPKIGMSGEITFAPSLDFNDEPKQAFYKYFIHYSKVLDMAPYFSVVSASGINDYTPPIERVIRQLNDPERQASIYQELFQTKLQGNGLQFVIIASDIAAQECGHVICTFLASEFGADITFVDPVYRPKTKGQLQYVGDKIRGEQHIRELRDMIFCMSVQSALDSAKFGNGLMNLEAYFDNDAFTIEDMFHAYHLLFPNDRLPPGEYTIPHMKKMIIGRLLDSTGKSNDFKIAKDLGVDFYAYDNMIEQYTDSLTTPEEDFSGYS